MTITTKLYTFFHGAKVGVDSAGNCYYRQKKVAAGHQEKRWVIYNGNADPSRVPPEWHGWLHYTTDIPPTEQKHHRYAWEKPHVANLTGTSSAYVPPGHVMSGTTRAKNTADYEPWRP